MEMIWAIGDIHGQYDQLLSLLDALDENKIDLTKDKLIFLGDYVDRGLQSKEVLEGIRQLQSQYPKNVVALKGNHEDFMIRGLKGEINQYLCWLHNGGRQTLQSFGGEDKIDAELLAWMDGLPLFHEEPGFFFSHAPVRATYPKPYPKEALIWEVPPYQWTKLHTDEEGNPMVGVCGHMHERSEEPRLHPNYLYVDTGCGCWPSAPLTAVEVKSRKVIQAFPEDE